MAKQCGGDLIMSKEIIEKVRNTGISEFIDFQNADGTGYQTGEYLRTLGYEVKYFGNKSSYGFAVTTCNIKVFSNGKVSKII